MNKLLLVFGLIFGFLGFVFYVVDFILCAYNVEPIWVTLCSIVALICELLAFLFYLIDLLKERKVKK